jgi:hypothetical protein
MTEVVPYTASSSSNGKRDWVELIPHAIELASKVADTQFVPPGLRGKPDATLAAIMYGHEIGLGPMQSLARIAMIDGHPSVAAETQRALVLREGHELWVEEATTQRVTLAGRRRGSEQTTRVTFDMDDARRAGLASKPSWKAYPRPMLLARATSELVRILFPDVVGGLGTSDELDEQAVVPELEQGEQKVTRRRRRAPAAVAAESSPKDESEHPDVEHVPPLPDELSDEQRAAEQTSELSPADELAQLAAQHEAGQLENERLVQKALDDVGAVELIHEKQRTKLHALFGERGVTAREARLAYCTTVAGRTIESSNELTRDEADKVIDALEQWVPDDPDSRPFPTDDIPY